MGLFPGSGRGPGGGNGNPLQDSCQENPMDRGAWWATVMGLPRVRHDWAQLITYLSGCGVRFEREHSVTALCSKQVYAHNLSCNFLFLFQSLSTHILNYLDTGDKSCPFAKNSSYQMTLIFKTFFFFCQNVATEELPSTQLRPSSVNGGAESPTLSTWSPFGSQQTFAR